MVRKKSSYFLYIVESPNDKDLFQDRTEGKLLLEALRLAQVSIDVNNHVQYRLVVSVDAFYQALLAELPIKLKDHKDVTPILHLSMHGDIDGLQLTDGTDISWKELAKLLSIVNRKFAHNKLIVCVSACHGFYGGIMQFYSRRKRPFKALIGPMNKPRWDEAAVAYVTFYHLLMNKGRSIETSVRAMKMASGNQKYRSTTPEKLLVFMRNYEKKQENSKG